jgi:parallel beta-helix repeat protein
VTVGSVDDRIQDWLKAELDAVEQPQRAIDGAVRSASHTPQRRPRRGLRAWLADFRGGDSSRMHDDSPEVILVATAPSAADLSGGPGVRAARPARLPLAVGAAMVSVLAVASGALLVSLSGSPDGAPGEGGIQYGALAMVEPVPEGRDIVVAADASGHFLTISDAVSQSVDGDRIIVMPGTYRDAVRVSKDVSISGQGDRDEVIVRPLAEGPLDVPDGYNVLAEFVPVGEEPEDAPMPADWRYVFHLLDSDARISGMTIAGSKVGSAFVVDGGEPELTDLVIDPDGTQSDGVPESPHEALSVFGSSGVTLQDSRVTGLISIQDASPATLRDNQIIGTCLVLADPGSDALVTGNTIETSPQTGQCVRFTVALLKGAKPTIESNHIVSANRTDGIRVLGPDTAPTISGNNVTGGASGIWIGGDAEGLISRNNVSGAKAGIKIVAASPSVQLNGFTGNEVGVSIDAASAPEFIGNEVCDNAINLELGLGVAIPMEQNPDVCMDAPADNAE